MSLAALLLAYTGARRFHERRRTLGAPRIPINPRRRDRLVRIESIETLRAIAAGIPPRRIEISELLLLGEENQRWQAALNKHLSVCGCGEAAAALIGAIVALTGFVLVLQHGTWWQRATIVIVGASALMTIVKLLTVKRAHDRFRATIIALLDHLQGRT